MSRIRNSLLPLLVDIENDPKEWAAQLIVALEDAEQFREIPTGTIMYWANDTDPPQGWRECAGAICNQLAFAELFHAIGTLWNTGGEVADEFRLPDLSGDVFAHGAWMIKL